MPSPTDSPNVVESHMVSMYGKYVSMVSNSQILTIWDLLHDAP